MLGRQSEFIITRRRNFKYSNWCQERQGNTIKTRSWSPNFFSLNCSSDDSYEENDAAGVIKGTKVGGETWQCDETKLEIPLEFLTSVGIFEVPPSDCGELTLTAQHLSFIEFFAAAGILLTTDIKSELKKIQNWERFQAVSVYIRKYFV